MFASSCRLETAKRELIKLDEKIHEFKLYSQDNSEYDKYLLSWIYVHEVEGELKNIEAELERARSFRDRSYEELQSK